MYYVECSKIIFKCQKCGHCCEGKGGIVLSHHDIERLARFLKINRETLIQSYIYQSNDKYKIKSNKDGKCVFFNEGCSVHPAKPDICRAWPFFRGNLEDIFSLEMAKEFCPGINKNCNLNEFQSYGLNELEQNDLLSSNPAANALKVSHLLHHKKN